MNDIAPQDYQGPAPEELKTSGNTNVKVNEIKEVNPPKESPIDEVPIEKEPAVDQIKEETSILEDEAKKELSKILEAPPILERKILIYFKANSNELPDQSYKMLNRIAEFMLHSSSAKINIKGYTDSTGDYSYNISVSRFRANTIKTYLVGKGVDPANIKADGLGPENPIATNEIAEGRQKNRRVEIEISVEGADG